MNKKINKGYQLEPDIKDIMEAESPTQTFSFSFPANNIAGEDLNAIVEINRIALNIEQMRQLLEA